MLSNNIVPMFIMRNWVGELKLNFGLRNNRNTLLKRWHRGPFIIQKPFYYDDNVPHVYLLHPPGGLVAGDQLYLEIDLEENSHVLLTMPGATKFYRSDGMYVFVRQNFNLSKGSALEWLPQCNIFFSKSKVIIESNVWVAEGARFIFFESLCFCCVPFQEVCTGRVLNIFVSVVLENAIGLRERIKVNYSDEFLNKFSGYQVSAVLYALPSDIHVLNDVRILIKKYGIAAGGATLLDKLLVVRLLDNEHECVQAFLRVLWCFLRPSVVGKQPVVPRVWST
ncbi:urease accessory protein UreD [Blochmannia endosymbiont of Polyrhachis (Hedomyrma) turneri]|uniref:urease accessory protein UreD n=1 Tax=Blochmannia endosymbiont of Polyrhachis (Hedomyrma) turneri TaxID=1505596 RepID=UPI00061A6128|nr:urease accessory protein UreD [Blochmannia endosymbiont of Polyrhachis (Hedomyrma) turneri]AKC60085.1 urease accessory protein ureD [Blochmannia endosymbiont of Polyrhachis (Hedomyrma) turneri]